VDAGAGVADSRFEGVETDGELVESSLDSVEDLRGRGRGGGGFRGFRWGIPMQSIPQDGHD
jgi:hypothetical protein